MKKHRQSCAKCSTAESPVCNERCQNLGKRLFAGGTALKRPGCTGFQQKTYSSALTDCSTPTDERLSPCHGTGRTNRKKFPVAGSHRSSSFFCRERIPRLSPTSNEMELLFQQCIFDAPTVRHSLTQSAHDNLRGQILYHHHTERQHKIF